MFRLKKETVIMKTELILGATTRPCNMLSVEEAFDHIAAAGFKHVALFRHKGDRPIGADSTPADVSRVRRLADERGLTISMLLSGMGVEGDFDAAVEAYCRVLDNAAALGASWVLDCGCMSPEKTPEYIRRMARAAEHAASAGVRITLKPHGGLGLTAKGLLDTWRAVNHPAFTLCYDPGNIIYYTAGELRPEPDVRELASHVSTVIIKDCTVSPEGKPDVQVTPGDGLVDFPTVLGTLRAAGFSGPCYLECVGSKTFPEIDRDLAFSLGYTRGILEALQTA